MILRNKNGTVWGAKEVSLTPIPTQLDYATNLDIALIAKRVRANHEQSSELLEIAIQLLDRLENLEKFQKDNLSESKKC